MKYLGKRIILVVLLSEAILPTRSITAQRPVGTALAAAKRSEASETTETPPRVDPKPWLVRGIDKFLEDFLGNFIWLLVQTALTVFLVDRLLRIREERKWTPAKGIIYSSMLETADRLLLWLLPAHFREDSSKVYTFGPRTVRTLFVPGDVGLLDLRRVLRREARSRQLLISAVTNDAMASLRYAATNIPDLVLAPEFYHSVLDIENHLSALSSLTDTDGLKSESEEDYAEVASRLAMKLLSLRAWLLTQADSESDLGDGLESEET